MTQDNLRGISRRTLMARAALIGAGLTAGPLVLAACSGATPQIDNRSAVKMTNRKLGALKVSELGAGCMSISANYGPPADKARASPPSAPHMTTGSHSSIPLKSTAPIPTKPLSERHLRLSATRSRSPASSVSTSLVRAVR